MRSIPETADIEPELALARDFYLDGRLEEAKAAYLAALGKAPTHFAALNNFATLLYETGHRAAARIVYREMLRHHPLNKTAHLNFANLRYADGNLAAALLHYSAALKLDPDYIEAHRGIANVYGDLGEEESANYHRAIAYSKQTVFPLLFLGKPPGIRLLALFSTTGGNVPTKPLIDPRIFAVTAIAADYFDPLQPLPPHELVFNALGDADRCLPALQRAEFLLARTEAPVINHPAAIGTTNRAAIATRFSGYPGIVTPRIATFAKADISPAFLAEEGFGFPLLLRAPGFHTGQHFLKVDCAAELDAALLSLPGESAMAIEYMNAQGADGFFRKYRVMMVGGTLYPLHLAVSRGWKVHYFSADMADTPAHRTEEEAFLDDMPGMLGPRIMEALETIRDELCLDYGGMDFAVSPEGDLLLFETNATMVLVEPDADPRWDYRREPFRRVRQAVRAMLLSRTAPCS